MLPYILHSSILLALFSAFYWLLLRKETFYKLNRFFLVFSLILALLLPLLSVPAFLSFHAPDTIEVIDNIKQSNESLMNATPNEIVMNEKEPPVPPTPSSTPQPLSQPDNSNAENSEIPVITANKKTSGLMHYLSNLKMQTILWYVYIIGAIIFSLTFLIQLSVILFKRSKLEYIQDGHIRIYELTDEASPFSFLNWIFINPASYDYDTYTQILEHEKIHVNQSHFADKLLAEFMVIVFWFNPFAWIYRKMITNNLEFLTDSEMLNKGTEKEIYQMSLLRVSVPDHALNLTTNYNESFLQERLKMMNSKRSSAKSSWKYLMLFPIIGLSVSSLNAVIPIETVISKIALADESTDKEKDKKQKNKTKKLNNKEAQKPKGEVSTDVAHTQIKSNDENIMLDNRSDEDILKMQQNLDKALRAEALSRNAFNSNKVNTGTQNLGQVISDVVTEAVTESTKQTAKNANQCDSELHTSWAVKNAVDWNGVNIDPGEWEGKLKNNQLCVYMDNSKKWNRCTISTCFDKNEISNFKTDGNVNFRINRDPGTLVLNGTFNGKKGSGTYEFEPNKSFVAQLEKSGYSDFEDDDLFSMFIHETDLSMASLLKQIDSGADPGDIVSLSIHGVDKDRLKEFKRMNEAMGGRNIDAGDLVSMQIHGVDEDLVEAFAEAGLSNVDTDDLVSASIHGVDPEFITAVKSYGFTRFGMDDIVSMSIHGIDEDDLEGYYNAGMTDLSADDIVQFGIHGVKPHDIAKAKENGFENVDADELVAFEIHGVDYDVVTEFQKMGIKELDADDIVALSIHGVSPSYVREFRDMGYKIDPDEMTAMAIHGVRASNAKEFKQMGLDLDADDLVEFSIHGVRPELYKAALDAGFDDLEPSHMTAAAIHGISPNYIKDITDIIGSDFDFDDLVSARIHGVNKRFLQRVTKDSKNKELDDYIKMKIHGF